MNGLNLCLAALFLNIAPQGGTGSAAVAVVSVPLASEQYRKTRDLEVHFDALRRAFNEDRGARADQIERAQKSLQEEFKPGTDEYRTRVSEIKLMEAQLQVFIEAEGEKIEHGLTRSLRAIFDDIQAAVREVAEEKHLDIVLGYDQMPEDLPNTTTQIRQQILLQKVLYWNPRVDITGDVVQRLNAKYQSPVAPPLPPGTTTSGGRPPAADAGAAPPKKP